MFAIPTHYAQQLAPRKTARDTGVVFPFGVNGRDIRVRLLTDDPDKAKACGSKLHEFGLRLVPEIITLSRNTGAVAFTMRKPKKPLPGSVGDGPWPLAFGGDLVVLETCEVENLRRFGRWYDEKADAESQKPKTLTDLANEGGIETIDAKDLT